MATEFTSAQGDSRIKRREGFTLIEIMAVVLIMGMLMGLVGVAVYGRLQQATVASAKAQMRQIEQALELYRMDNSRYPTTAQGLDALVAKPSAGPTPRNYPPGGYLAKKDGGLVDPWDAPFHYESPGVQNERGFDLCSFGADNSPGGEEVDADICNYSDSSG